MLGLRKVCTGLFWNWARWVGHNDKACGELQMAGLFLNDDCSALPQPQGFKYLNMKYTPQTLLTICEYRNLRC